MEGILNPAVPAARHLRCGYFMENLLHQAEAIAYAGVFTLPLPPDVPLAFVAARDIGAAAGRLVLDPVWSGVAAVEAYGPAKLTCAEAAEVLATALGRPVRYAVTPAPEWIAQLVGHGVSRAMAVSLADMFAAITAGRDMGGTASAPAECPTTLGEWAAAELAPPPSRPF